MVPGSWSGSGGLQSPPEAGLGEGLGGEGEGRFLQNLLILQKSLKAYGKIYIFVKNLKAFS